MKIKTFFIFSLLCLVLSCGESTTGPEPHQACDWPTSSPDAQGVDGEILSTALDNAGNYGYIKGVLIVRNGFLIAERYYRNYDSNDAHNVMSVSKSFLSALIGIAVREGFIDNLDRPVIDYFPEHNTSTLNANMRKITIHHLLSMRSGIDSDRNIFFQVFESDDPVAAAFHYPLRDEPGTRFIYTTAGTHILCALLSKATGMTAFEFAQSYLFEPLGISIREWRTDPNGYYIGGSDMYFAPRDMARFGDLYMDDGLLDDVQIVPQDWVTASRIDYSGYNDVSWGRLEDMGYGYLWWLGRINGYRFHLALGHGGQFIMNIPHFALTIVTVCDWELDWETADSHERGVTELIADHIFPAIKDFK